MENCRDYNLLLKSYWDVADISNYYGLSESKAIDVKSRVVELFGKIPCEQDNIRGKVSADDVIKVMGGKSRLEEIQILKLSKEIKNG